MLIQFQILRLLLIWLGKLKGIPRTWPEREELEISALLKKCNATLPTEIHRSIRSLDHICYWKGTEFRTFLMYLGIVILKPFLAQHEYEMFVKLHCAVTICSTNAYSLYQPLARRLFTDFIEEPSNFMEREALLSTFIISVTLWMTLNILVP